jgi:glucosylceramidase
MALNAQSPTSTWGWYQNSLILVDGDDYRYTPEFYLVKHFAHFVKEGAVMLGTKGGFSSNATVFRNPDGSRVAILMNPFDFEKVITIEGGNYVLEPNSFNTILL